MYVCMYVCMYIYIRMNVCMYIYIHTSSPAAFWRPYLAVIFVVQR